MSGKKHKGSLCKIHMEYIKCRKVVYSENQHLHIQRSHNNNTVGVKKKATIQTVGVICI